MTMAFLMDLIFRVFFFIGIVIISFLWYVINHGFELLFYMNK